MPERKLTAAEYSRRCSRRRYHRRVALAQRMALLACVALALGGRLKSMGL